MKKAKKTRSRASSKAALVPVLDEVSIDMADADVDVSTDVVDVVEVEAIDVVEAEIEIEQREIAVMAPAQTSEALPKAAEPRLAVQISNALHQKLVRTAQDEGIALDALVSELLAEGVVLRAWEIVERKNAMRGGVQPSNQQQGGGNNRHGGGGNNNRSSANTNNRNNRGPSNNNNNNRRGVAPNNAWMEDKATFLEYVRNQEKQRRR